MATMENSPVPIMVPKVNPAEPIMGGLAIEIFFAFILYGITTLQTFMYFQRYPEDRTSLKWLVATVWILESVHTGFSMQFIYNYLIAGFSNYANFNNINWGIGVSVVCSSGIALCVQGYYTWRVWIVSGKSIAWTFIIGFFALLRIGFGIASAVLSYVFPQWTTFRDTKASLICISGALGCAALVDVLVALTLTWYLKRGQSDWQASNNMVNQILLYAVNTGAITGTTSLLCVILFAIEKSSLVFLGLVLLETKLYANSLLGSLNARSHLRGKASRPTYSSTTSSGFRLATPRVPVVEVFQQTDILDDRGNPAGDSDYHLKSMKGGELA